MLLKKDAAQCSALHRELAFTYLYLYFSSSRTDIMHFSMRCCVTVCQGQLKVYVAIITCSTQRSLSRVLPSVATGGSVAMAATAAAALHIRRVSSSGSSCRRPYLSAAVAEGGGGAAQPAAAADEQRRLHSSCSWGPFASKPSAAEP